MCPTGLPTGGAATVNRLTADWGLSESSFIAPQGRSPTLALNDTSPLPLREWFLRRSAATCRYSRGSGFLLAAARAARPDTARLAWRSAHHDDSNFHSDRARSWSLVSDRIEGFAEPLRPPQLTAIRISTAKARIRLCPDRTPDRNTPSGRHRSHSVRRRIEALEKFGADVRDPGSTANRLDVILALVPIAEERRRRRSRRYGWEGRQLAFQGHVRGWRAMSVDWMLGLSLGRASASSVQQPQLAIIKRISTIPRRHREIEGDVAA